MVREHQEVEQRVSLKHKRIAEALERIVTIFEEGLPPEVERRSSGSEVDTSDDDGSERG